MKTFFLALFVLVCSISFAQGDRVLSLRQSITEELRVKTFDNLVRSSYFSLGTTEHAAPNDTTSTGTAGQLAPGECWEKIYFNEPDLIFGGIEAATFSIQIFKQAAE